MRQLLILLTVTLFFAACEKQGDISSELTNEEKIQQLIADSDKPLTVTALTQAEVAQYLSEANQNEASVRGINPGGVISVNELVIICYDCGGSSETCFGVWGTDDCGDVNCNEGCCCYE